MIAPKEATQLIERHAGVLGTETIRLTEASGRVLAEDVVSPFALPRFDNSAMDGFALRAADTPGASAEKPVRLPLDDTIFAGADDRRLATGRACRIMTGAPLPEGSDTVLPVELATVEEGSVVISGEVAPDRHVRRAGEDVPAGSVLVARGTVVHPGVIACLATVGRTHVDVVRRPRVAVITTGDETVPPGTDLEAGQIYDSNTPMVVAMLGQLGIEPAVVRHVRDELAPLRDALSFALDACDVVITVGGVSMGEHDLVRSTLHALGTEEVFWRISQKPGKPLYFGKRGDAIVFGLPGNPASAFVCFYVYVFEALERLMGYGEGAGLTPETRVSGEHLTSDDVRWTWTRAHDVAGAVSPLTKQGSHMVSSLAETDRLIVVPAGEGDLPPGTSLVTLRLPHERDDGG